MRKLLSILLLAAFGLPFVSPLFALGADGGGSLPVCCRRNGKHHCMMSTGERSTLASHDPQFRAPAEKCPYFPQALAAAHTNLYTAPTADVISAGLVSHPAGVAQTESKWRISRDRSRQKRGPPSV
ncbi:hypothetical protein [Edaphobacter bradus]|uniref:hypothetical protein n=1 Tax=Edaphobacter bradus TaxID=2259016 RepID=UPI0021E051DF|nr:hypothetical protein [Edaphobacter bradus]